MIDADELQRWLAAHVGVLLNIGVSEPDPPTPPALLAWLSWSEDGQQLEMPWRVDSTNPRGLSVAIAQLLAWYDQRAELAATDPDV